MYKKYIGLILSVAILNGCAESTGGGSTGGTISSKLTPNPDLINRLPGEVYYTGFDGGNGENLAVLVTTRRSLEIVDSSIATLQFVDVQIPQATVDQMITELKNAGEQLSPNREQRLKERLLNPKAWKIIPKKVGATYIKATRAPRSNGEVRWESVWYKPELRTLVVEDYGNGLLATGKNRYDNGGSGSQSCVSCHGNPDVGIPAHQIGRVVELSDEDAIQWISTGRVGIDGRVATDPLAMGHAWNFASELEKKATIAYLRSVQTKDITELSRLLFDEALADLKAENIN